MTAYDAAPAGSGIRCLLQSAAAHPGLSVETPPAWLSAAELDRWQEITAPQRRLEWLLGRWTAKRLVQRCLAERGGPPPLDALVIGADRDGAPYAGQCQGEAEVRLPVSLSISHSDGWAFCALGDGPGAVVGADIERIAPRAPSFPAMFFSEEEQAAVRAAAPALREVLITALWSAREAAFKALRLALLRTDPRRIACRIPTFTAAPAAWTPLTIALDPALAPPGTPPLAAWWRVETGLVLTLIRLGYSFTPAPAPADR